MKTIIRTLATDASGQPNPSDIAAMTAIYRHHVLHGTASFEIDPPSIGDMESRMMALIAKDYPVLIAERYDGVVVGYAYAGPHKPRAAYDQTVEDSVYLDKDCLGKGIGRQLLTALIDAATARGFYQMMAVIGDSANAASVGLHNAVGFRHIGTAQEIGFKFGRRLDIVYMQRALQG
ncbi:MAG: GNAT family N-acetyltransferase [Candidatus Puniceispirillaceae bacterium]